jgi:hypothetical protein
MKAKATDPINATLIIGPYGQVTGKHYGLTKREHFAGLAMQGLLACTQHNIDRTHVDELTNTSVIIADALIAELNKTE